jgi:pimeloyl-ACP methyl ester carboxylesterase
MFTAAENALDLFRILEIDSAHIVAHDMGDSVVTEIMARRQRDMLPRYFKKEFFKVE